MKVDNFSTTQTYKTIYIDPPWEENGGGKIKRGADRHYKGNEVPEERKGE